MMWCRWGKGAGSENAFRELVTRYFGLVYAAALRLVGGDTHLAEDVAQTVFADLARNARRLSGAVVLGGWLHQRTYHVAAPLMRARRRREEREREATLMSTLQDESDRNLAQIEPILHEAITQLHCEERTAILLRFFERRDFRAGGRYAVAVGRWRPASQLCHLRGLRQGPHHCGTYTMKTAALGFVVVAAIVAAAVAVPITLQRRGHAKYLENDAALQARAARLAELSAVNERLSNEVTRLEGAALTPEQSRELLRLRGQVGPLCRAARELEQGKQVRASASRFVPG